MKIINLNAVGKSLCLCSVRELLAEMDRLITQMDPKELETLEAKRFIKNI